MKKLLLSLILVGLLAGCAMPPGVKGALYTAQLTSEVTVLELDQANRPPWQVDPNAPVEMQLAETKAQVKELKEVLKQVNANLIVVVAWVRGVKVEETK